MTATLFFTASLLVAFRTSSETPPRVGCDRWRRRRSVTRRLVGFGRDRDHMHLLARLAEARELHLPVDEREQRVVLAAADVQARMHDGATLANEDHARSHGFTTELLHTQPLSLRLAAVLGRGLTFFVSHGPFR